MGIYRLGSMDGRPFATGGFGGRSVERASWTLSLTGLSWPLQSGIVAVRYFGVTQTSQSRARDRLEILPL